MVSIVKNDITVTGIGDPTVLINQDFVACSFRLLQLDQFIPICIFKSIIDAAAVDKF